mgnify:CR=1 FL=1
MLKLKKNKQKKGYAANLKKNRRKIDKTTSFWWCWDYYQFCPKITWFRYLYQYPPLTSAVPTFSGGGRNNQPGFIPLEFARKWLFVDGKSDYSREGLFHEDLTFVHESFSCIRLPVTLFNRRNGMKLRKSVSWHSPHEL